MPWSEDRIRRELSDFLAGRKEWPSYRDFVRAGRGTLREQVTRQGGARSWAKRLGVRYVERKPGYPQRWTEERVRSELREFLRGQASWPPRSEFDRAGREDLWRGLGLHGGPKRWARELGLPLAGRRHGSKRLWTEARLERELRRFLRGRSVWPARGAFVEAGAFPLLAAVYRYGGTAEWAKRMGVRYEARSRGKVHRKWDEERIRDELGAFCSGRDDWPPESDFEQAGRRALYCAASSHGGVERWARELGLTRGRRRQPARGSANAAPTTHPTSAPAATSDG